MIQINCKLNDLLFKITVYKVNRITNNLGILFFNLLLLGEYSVIKKNYNNIFTNEYWVHSRQWGYSLIHGFSIEAHICENISKNSVIPVLNMSLQIIFGLYPGSKDFFFWRWPGSMYAFLG